MSETTVIHVKDAPDGWQSDPRYVYIGRAVGRKGLRGSIWQNKAKISPECSREESLRRFREWLDLVALPRMQPQLEALRGKILVCWCAPAGVSLTAAGEHLCHGQILAEAADRECK